MQKPRLQFWQIVNMSIGFFGIQFGWNLQLSNMSAIYEYLGANADQLPLLWLAAPLDWPAGATRDRPHERPHLGTAWAAAGPTS